MYILSATVNVVIRLADLVRRSWIPKSVMWQEWHPTLISYWASKQSPCCPEKNYRTLLGEQIETLCCSILYVILLGKEWGLSRNYESFTLCLWMLALYIVFGGIRLLKYGDLQTSKLAREECVILKFLLNCSKSLIWHVNIVVCMEVHVFK